MSSDVATVLALARRGWHVFPLIPDNKRPAIRDWENRATTEPNRIARCWQAGPYGIGIACGPSGLVVIDLDRPKGDGKRPLAWQIPGVECGEDALAVVAERASQPFEPLVDTYSLRTGSGGLHLYYAAPDVELRNTAGQLGWLIDTRAAGGYVVAAGTTVAGKTYTLVADTKPAPLPRWLAERLAPAKPAADCIGTLLNGLTHRHDYATSALRGEVQRVLDAADGTRNNTLVRAAFALGQLVAGGLLPGPLVEEALTAAGEATGLPTREVSRTIASGLRSGMAKPRGGVA